MIYTSVYIMNIFRQICNRVDLSCPMVSSKGIEAMQKDHGGSSAVSMIFICYLIHIHRRVALLVLLCHTIAQDELSAVGCVLIHIVLGDEAIAEILLDGSEA